MKRKFLLVGLSLTIVLLWCGNIMAQNNSGQWRGFINGTQVQMPTGGGGLIPQAAPGQEVPLMYGPGGQKVLLEAIARAETPEGKDYLMRFLPLQNTIDAAPPISPPLTASFTGPAWGGIWTPGDPVIAAGQNHVGVMINSQCDFYTKAGVWAGGSILKIFFAPVFDTLTYRDPFDVKIIFDHHNNRWVMLALTYSAGLTQSRYLVAVSQTINPLGLWWIWALNSTDPLEPAPAKWADYPGLGFDADSGIYITSNQYTYANAFTYAKIRALRKGALYSGSAVWWDYWNMSDQDGAVTFTIKPAHTFGNPGMEYLANTKWNGGPPSVVNLWNLLPGGALTNMGAVPIGAHVPPPVPMCSDSGLNLFDCRTQDVQYRDNHLYTSFHEEHPMWGNAAVRFLKINIPTMFAVIDERYGHPNYHYFFPSIYSSPNGNIVTVFNRCGYGEMGFEFISARYSTRFLTLGDVASRGSLYLQAGQGPYSDWRNPNRWGDYSGIAYDPFQFNTIWIYSMYATLAPKPANWSTWIGSVLTHPATVRNHFKTWRIQPQTFNMTVFVQDQFMSDDLVLDTIEFFSNPAKKDTFEIVDSLEHLTWYRAHGRDTLLEVEFENQFGTDTVRIDSVKYLLLPTAKESYPFPESLDHYKAYRIKDPIAFDRSVVLEDQFDILYGAPEFIETLTPKYFITPALKNMEQPQMFDSITHYVAYEIFPKRFFPLPVNTFDQFGDHFVQVDTSEFLLVPTTKLRAEPPPPPDTLKNHYKTWRIEPQTFQSTVFTQDQFMEDSLELVGLEFLSNPVRKIVQNDTFNIIKPDDHLTWYRAIGRDTLIQVGWVNQFQTVPFPVPIDSVKYLLVPTQKQPHAPPAGLDHYKCYRIAMDTGWVETYLTLQDQFDPIPEDIMAMSTPIYFCAPCQKNSEPIFDTTTHYVAYLISPQTTSSESRSTIDQFGSHFVQVLNSEMLLVPSKKWLPPPCNPPNINCPTGEIQNQNGVYTTTAQWNADDGNPTDPTINITSVTICGSLPSGITGAVVNVDPPGLPAKTATGTVTYTVGDHCQSGGAICLKATNSCTPAKSDSCTFNVTLVNNPPVITCPPNASFSYNAGYNGNATATDADGDTIAFSKVSGPTGLFVLSNGAITWVTTCADIGGPYTVSMQVQDVCNAADTCTFQLTVTNSPPVITQPDTLSGFVGYQISYNIGGADPDSDMLQDQASISVIPSCGSYSINRISGQGTSSGTWQVSWQTSGCSVDTYLVVHDLTDTCGAVSYCTTTVYLYPEVGWYWKPPYPDYAPSGMPDFDQKQDSWIKLQTGQFTFCGPAAVANCFWWFDSKYQIPPLAPGDGMDMFPLVRDYMDNNPPFLGGMWDDHDPWNVDHVATPWTPPAMPPPPATIPFVPGPQPQPSGLPPWGELVERLAWYFDTDGIQTGYCQHTGTNIVQMYQGIQMWLASEPYLMDTFCVVMQAKPTFAHVESLVEKSEDVILLLGFWFEDPAGSGIWYRCGGHYVTVAGVNSEQFQIAFSDPYFDAAEMGMPGRVGNGMIIQHLPGHPAPTHNDAGNVSHDIYSVLQPSPSPGGLWALPDYPGDCYDFNQQNIPDEFLPMYQTWNGVSPVFTEAEYAIHISPWDYRGDVNIPNGDGVVDIGDVVYLINYLFKHGPEPVPYIEGDTNCDGIIDVGDVVILINYLFKNGPVPKCCDP